ncbi:hypothetical protein [Sporosarcina sp. FSL K6-2383]|uniref:hypothetical protein n=1 Tax=Sporosarcina sp. FSL K6-2383 TaxID=2921556 RepID=UPI00315A1AC8
MRTLLLAALLFIAFHVIRMDLVEGTISLSSFVNEDEPASCEEQLELTSIPITIVAGDTIESLFALYPDPDMSFLDRLHSFYALNPHLQNQQLFAGDKIDLPLSHIPTGNCTESIR